MGRRGRKRQLDLKTEYWRLLASGVGTVAACKLLGIGRKTGYRWRAENGGLPPGRFTHTTSQTRPSPLTSRVETPSAGASDCANISGLHPLGVRYERRGTS